MLPEHCAEHVTEEEMDDEANELEYLRAKRRSGETLTDDELLELGMIEE